MAKSITFDAVPSDVLTALNILHDILVGEIDIATMDIQQSEGGETHALALVDAMFFAGNISQSIVGQERNSRARFLLDAIKVALGINGDSDIPRLLLAALFVFCENDQFTRKYPKAKELLNQLSKDLGQKLDIQPSDIRNEQ